MIKLILILLLIPSIAFSQSRGTVLHGNQLWLVNTTPSGQPDSVRVGGETQASIIDALGYTPLTQAAVDSKADKLNANDAGTVTQTGNKSTAVTLNKLVGKITMVGSALAAAAEVSFTVNNSLVTTNDVPVVAVQAVGNPGAYFVTVGRVDNGSFTITVGNASTASLSQAIVLNFIIIKAQ